MILSRSVDQIGIVVRDIDAALAMWTQALGVGPFFVSRARSFPDFHYRGLPSPSPTLSIALAQAGPVQIELIQQLDEAPSAFQDFIASGNSGIQHVASMFRDMRDYDQSYAQLAASGYDEIQSGVGSGGRWAYLGREGSELPLFELCETNGVLGEVFDRVRAAAVGWDGMDPVRESGWSSPVPT